MLLNKYYNCSKSNTYFSVIRNVFNKNFDGLPHLMTARVVHVLGDFIAFVLIMYIHRSRSSIDYRLYRLEKNKIKFTAARKLNEMGRLNPDRPLHLEANGARFRPKRNKQQQQQHAHSDTILRG